MKKFLIASAFFFSVAGSVYPTKAQEDSPAKTAAEFHCAYLMIGKSWDQSIYNAFLVMFSNGARKEDMPPGDVISEVNQICPALNNRAWQRKKLAEQGGVGL